MYLGRGYDKTYKMEVEMTNNESPLVIKLPVRSMRIVIIFAQ